MSRPEGAADQPPQLAGTAGQAQRADSLAEHAEVGKQGALHRRHLDESQRAMVAGKLAKLTHGGDRKSPIGDLTQAKAAELLNVSRQTESAQICAVTQTQAALTRLGEILAAMPKNAGAAGGGKKDAPRGSIVEPRDTTPTLADLGIDKKVRP